MSGAEGFEALPPGCTRPSRETARELVRRYGFAGLVELAERPSEWNLVIPAIEHGETVLDSHANDPRPPEPRRAEIHAELRRHYRRVLRAPPARRRAILQAASADLSEWRDHAIETCVVDEWADLARERLR